MSGHKILKVAHGWWFFRSSCTCGWVSRRRWQAKRAEADLMIHQRASREVR